MRLIKVAATIGMAAAVFLGTAGMGSAAPADHTPLTGPGMADRGKDVSAQRTTDGNSFVEVNGAGQLVYWTRAGESFSRQVRGQGWENTHQITSLDANTFLEVKPDYRLAKWTWNGSGYNEAIVGTGWNPARVITGISQNRFLEINTAGELVLWEFGANNGLARKVIGTGWQGTRTIAGMDDVDFFEIENGGGLAEWYDFQNGGATLTEIPFNGGTYIAQSRLIAGLTLDHFLVVGADGYLVEYVGTDAGYDAIERGQGWGTSRLIG